MITTLDVEAFLVSALGDVLAQPVYADFPGGRIAPPEFVVVHRVGGATLNRVSDRATVTVEAYGRTRAAAFALMADARQELHSLSGVHAAGMVYRIREYAGPGNLPDPRAPLAYRYTLTAEVHVRATRVVDES